MPSGLSRRMVWEPESIVVIDPGNDDAPASFAETALPGRAGKQIGELLKTAEQQGTRVLAKLVKQALNRMGNSPMGIRTATTMFTRKEREELADALANAIGTANLLGRARIRGLLARKVRIPFAEGGWDESEHPRDDDGKFVNAAAIADAKGDAGKEKALREKVTDPKERAKLDKALGGKGKSLAKVSGRTAHAIDSLKGQVSEPLHKSLTSSVDSVSNAGFDVPGFDIVADVSILKKVHGNNWKNVPASVEHDGGQMKLVLNPMYFRTKDVASAAKTNHESGYTSSPSPDHVLIHEIGHTVNGLVEDGSKTFDGGDSAIAAKVSKRAQHSPNEFVAETFAGIVHGNKYDDSVMEAYAKYGGKLPAGSKSTPAQAAKEWKEKGTDAPAFKAWFGDSKVVDESGKPLVVYHGTNRDFKSFDPGKTGERIDTGWYGAGNYFTPDAKTAGEYATKWGADEAGAQTAPVFLSIKKPLYVNGSDTKHDGAMSSADFFSKYGDYKSSATEKTAKLKADGYDGVIILGGTPSTTEYLAFAPEQVKSKTANRGTFDPKSDDIRFADTPIVKPIPPESALEYFKSLVPSIAVDPETFGPLMRRQAFTMAATTDLVVLKRVQDALTASLETGTGGAWSVQEVLDSAGVSVSNPQYAEMVWRTNTHSAYLQGSEEERMEPDVVDYFPAWMWSTVVDGRERDRHGDLDGKLFPGTVSFQEVRGTDAADVINCRCVPIPMTADEIGDRKIETSW